MPEFRSLAALEAYLQGKVSDALEEYAAPEFEKIFTEHAQSDIYFAYSPQKYERRYSFLDSGNINTTVGNGVLAMEYNVPFSQNPRSGNVGNMLDGLINYGSGWGDYRINYPSARPFIDNTKQTVQSDGLGILKKALQQSGLKVE